MDEKTSLLDKNVTDLTVGNVILLATGAVVLCTAVPKAIGLAANVKGRVDARLQKRRDAKSQPEE